MDFRERLARLDSLTHKPDQRQPSASQRMSAQQLAALADELGLRPVAGSRQGVFSRQRSFDIPVAEFRGQDLAGLFTFTPEPDLQAEDLFFLDVETTGLAGGTGTIAFLVGLAWWEEQRFVVRQVFLADPDHEDQFLAAIIQAAADKRAVLTFNGASFDLPLLRTRALLNRRRGFLAEMASLDLIVPARRFWNRSLPDCRQQTLEVMICGEERGAGDIPGQDIPGVWFAFLRGENDPRLDRVLRHNERDMLGMAKVWAEILRWTILADGGPGAPGKKVVKQWHQAWALARVSALRGHRHMVICWLNLALDLLPSHPTQCTPSSEGGRRFWQDAVVLAKRQHDWDLLARVVQSGLGRSPHESWLHREASILHEYRLGNLDTALSHAYQCQDEARVARLLGRIARLSGTKDNGGWHDNSDA